MKRAIRLILLFALVLSCALPAAYAGTPTKGAPELQYWDTSSQVLRIDSQGALVHRTGGKTKTVSENRKNQSVNGFYVSGEYAVYYALNQSGYYKWFTYNTKTGAKKEYAYNTLSPFWADKDGVYTTTGGKRVYDYNVYRFNVKTGAKTKLASVYGMPIGYVGGELVALDFYHKEVRFYKGSTLRRSVKADVLNGFVSDGRVYAITKGALYEVRDGRLEKRIEGYQQPRLFCNAGVLLYPHDGFPKTVNLVVGGDALELGTAKNDGVLQELIQAGIDSCCAYCGS